MRYAMSNPVLMPHLDRSRLTIRPAEAEDILPCSRLDGAYQTNYVWQMHLQENERNVRIIFNQIRLPRTMAVDYPVPPAMLATVFEQAPYLLVAGYEDHILGCVDGVFDMSQGAFNINNLIVHSQVRRQGIGQLLLKGIKALAQQHASRQLLIAIQTKNSPAIEFVQKAGFVHCGYNDKYYNNGDIALIFSLKL